MTRVSNSDRVRLTPGNWIAVAGLVLSNAIIVGGTLIRMENRLTAIEIRAEATVQHVAELKAKVDQLERQ